MEADRALFWRLIEAEHLRARAFCRKLMVNRDDGDDLYQDTLVSALTRFSQLRNTSGFRPWLYRIAVNNFKNRVRRPWRRLTSLTPEIAEGIGGENPDKVQAARRQLEWAFRAVTPEERALVTLREMEGWTIPELVTLFGKNEGTVKMRLLRARRKMREALVKRFSQPKTVPVRPVEESEDSICVAVRPSED